MAYTAYNPWYGQVSTPWAYPIASPKNFRLGIYITETIPLSIMETYASIVGDQKLKKQATFNKGISKKMFDMQSIFFHFLNNLWRFEMRNTDEASALMSSEEKKEFKIDVACFDWEEGLFN